MATVQLCLLIVLLTVQAQTEPLPCPDINTVRKNNWPEDKTGYITSTPNAAGVTSVSWAPYDPTSDYIDASAYVDVTFNDTTQAMDFTALPSMEGVRDYPSKGYPYMAQLDGTCQMTCGSNTGEFQYVMTVVDKNTANPVFSSATYSLDIIETFPTGLTIQDLVISASDADADATNYELSFTLQDGSPFSLTPAVKTSDLEPTYTTQLVLYQPLDWATNPSYQLTVTAQDPGGLSDVTTVTVNVIDVDTMQPEFDQATYTAIVDDPESLGPLNVSIKAIDPDAPGKLIYELQDTTGQFAQYFSLDPGTAALSLTKDITDKLQSYETTVTFLLQATEDGGYGFSCRAELLILLPAMVLTTTAEPLPCPDIAYVLKNNFAEDSTEVIASARNADGVTSVSWATYSGESIDASAHVDVTYNEATQTIDFTPLPSMIGVRDYPQKGYPQLAKLEGTCQMTCGSDTGEFQFTMTVMDKDTAHPVFSSATYSVDIIETFPTDLTIPGLDISASDADADETNYELYFTLPEGSPFSLTEAVKTSDVEPTYTTQLVLDQPLDWATNPSYQLTITAQDPEGRSDVTTVTVNVIDVDTMQPEFDQVTYTVTVDDPESLGPLNVSIKAIDPDAPGTLIYDLHDTTGGQFAGYFSLDPDTAELSLTKDISVMLQSYETTVTFLLQATESGEGHGFSCRAALVVQLPALTMTTTTEPDLEPTYTTQLVLDQPLDWDTNGNSSYQLTVTAQ